MDWSGVLALECGDSIALVCGHNVVWVYGDSVALDCGHGVGFNISVSYCSRRYWRVLMIDFKKSVITNLVVTSPPPPPLPLFHHSVYNVRRNANIPDNSHQLAWHFIYTRPLSLVYS